MLEFNIKLLKKARFWAVAVPCVLLVWTVVESAAVWSQSDEASKKLRQSQSVQEAAREIVAILRESGQGELGGAALREFDAITSARLCAEAAIISEERLLRGESSKPKPQKDGSMLHRESYRLNGVHLLQVAKFIDYAERNFSSLNCTELTLTPLRSKSKDAWDANIDLQYLRKAK